jgi:hypothetical protein
MGLPQPRLVRPVGSGSIGGPELKRGLDDIAAAPGFTRVLAEKVREGL